jgi:hypothetical protein
MMLKLDLNSPDVEAELREKYEHLSDLSAVFGSVWYSYIYYNHALNGKPFYETGGMTSAYAPSSEPGYELGRALGEPTSKMHMGKNHVTMVITPPLIPFNIGWGVSDEQSDDVAVAEALKKAVSTIGFFVDGFKLPTTWTDDSGGELLRLDSAEKVSKVWLIEDPRWERIPGFGPEDLNPAVPADDEEVGVYVQGDYVGDDDDPAAYRGMTSVQFTLTDDLYFKPRKRFNDVAPTGTSGTIVGMRGHIQGYIQPTFYVKYPLEYAMWATGAATEKDLIPRRVADLFDRHLAHCLLDGQSPPERLGNFSLAKADNAARVKETGISPKPRVNADGFCVLATGRVAYIPQVDDIDAYHDLLRSAHDAETGELRQNVDVEGLPDRPLLSDWLNNKFVYTTSEGHVSLLDLTGAIPLSDVMIYQILAEPLRPVGDDSEIEGFLQVIDRYAAVFGVYKAAGEDARSVMEMYSVVSRTGMGNTGIPTDWTVGDLLGYSEVNEEVQAEIKSGSSEGMVFSQHVALMREIRRIVIVCFARFDEIQESAYTKIFTLRFWFVAFQKYGRDMQNLYHKFRDATNSNLGKDFAAAAEAGKIKFDIPNMPGLAAFMPHQARSVGRLTYSEPEAAALDMDPGAGKTLTYLSDMIHLIDVKKIKRGLIVCPGNLIREIVNEINDKSKGKINPFPFTVSTLQKMVSPRSGAAMTPEEVIEHIKSLPPNTVFITSYTFISARRDAIQDRWIRTIPYGETTIDIWPHVEFLRNFQFDYICIDESHRAKNEATAIARSLRQLTVEASVKRLSSGTLISNKPEDLVGQVGMINPRIYGNLESFRAKYGDTVTKDNERDINERMQPYLHRVSAKRREWSFMLPKIVEEFWSTNMTPLQTEYYEKLVEEALIKVMQELGRGGDKLLTQGSDDEDLDRRIEAKLQTHLARAEIFLAAPDEDSQLDGDGVRQKVYVNWEDPKTGKMPDGDDLVSPKVRVLNGILRGHFGLSVGREFKNVTADLTNKVIVFGYHKAVSKHIMRHLDPALKKMAIHYSAGEEAALLEFINNPNTKILVADETSLKEGHNLQVGSRIISMQTVWTPGAVNQKVARVMRPDPKQRYNRAVVTHDWILAQGAGGKQTIDTAKTARWISKMLDKSKIDNYHDPAWRRVRDDFDNLEVLRMNLNLIKTMTPSRLEPYYKLYSIYKKWEGQQFEEIKKAEYEKVAKRLGVDLADLTFDQFIKGAMVPVKNDRILPGSRSVYVPFVAGGGAPDDFNLGNLVPMSVASVNEDGEDDGEGDDEDVDPRHRVPYSINYHNGTKVSEKGDKTFVITEFGPGWLMREPERKRSGVVSSPVVEVFVPGFKKVTISKTVVYLPQTEEAQAKLAKLVKSVGAAGLSKMSDAGKPNRVDVTRRLPPALPEEDETEVPVESPDDPVSFSVEVSSINNMPALFVNNTDIPDPSALTHLRAGWVPVEDFFAMQVSTKRAMDSVISWLNTNYSVNAQQLEGIREFSARFVAARGRLQQRKPVKYGDIRNFFLLQHAALPRAKQGMKQEIRPWLVVWGGDVNICFNKRQHASVLSNSFWNKLQKLNVTLKEPGILGAGIYDGFMVNFYASKQEAVKDLKSLTKAGYGVTNYDEVLEELKATEFFDTHPEDLEEGPQVNVEPEGVKKKYKDPAVPAKKPPVKGPKPVKKAVTEEDDDEDTGPFPAGNQADFYNAYVTALTRAVKKAPDNFSFGVARVPKVAEKMVKALIMGTAAQSPTLKAVAQGLGVSPTLSAIKVFLAGK